jgi:hypothetical protein
MNLAFLAHYQCWVLLRHGVGQSGSERGPKVKLSNRKSKMLSTQTRLRLEDIAARIAGGLNVSLEEMQWATKWGEHNRSAAEILRRARRRAINGDPEKGSLDELLDGMDLGDPDPSNHLIGPQSPVDLAEWFRQNKENDWRQHD